MLKIENLHVRINDTEILKGIDLQINAGEVHAIMGPNGSGKSTLAHTLAGREEYTVTDGTITFKGQDLLTMPVEERAREGVFLAFQYPVEIPGLSNVQFLKASLNAMREHRGEPPLDTFDFLQRIKQTVKQVAMDESLLHRDVNSGFSGGEKKRNEILQMLLLQPSLTVLDETDSGLDIDALKTVADGVNALRGDDHAILMITHYQRLLNHIQPDRVHVMSNGRIVKSGGKELALELEEHGYSWLEQVA